MEYLNSPTALRVSMGTDRLLITGLTTPAHPSTLICSHLLDDWHRDLVQGSTSSVLASDLLSLYQILALSIS